MEQKISFGPVDNTEKKKIWGLLMASKNRKQIFQPKLLPKSEPFNLFFYPDKLV